jgi:CSLREA domain-containing protein
MQQFRRRLLAALCFLSLALSFIFNGGFATGSANSATSVLPAMACPSPFTVNHLGDTADASIGDGVCADASGNCTLRAAVQEANASACSPLTINLSLSGVINLGAELPHLDHLYLTIIGPGAASLNVHRNSAVKFRIFTVKAGKTVNLNGLTVSGGDADDGGGIQNSGTLNVNNCVISGNYSSYNGGGGIQNFAALNLNQSTLTGNSSNFAGGGLTMINGGTATITGSTISGNPATGGGVVIQGINTPANVTISNTTISGNTASVHCGGLLNVTRGAASNVTIINSTIARNAGAVGSGICNGGYDGSATLSLKNTIVANNTGGPQLSNAGSEGVTTSLGNNLISDASLPAVAGDLLNTNPILAQLGNYGGPTRTHALLPGSPAINAGNNADTAEIDQRGVLRAFEGTVDIGSFESRGFTMAISGGNNQSAMINTAFANPLRVAVTSGFGDPVNGGLVTFEPPVFDASAAFAPNPAAIKSGQASPTATANASGGSYTVTAMANGANAVTFNLTNTCLGKGCASMLNAQAGKSVSDNDSDEQDQTQSEAVLNAGHAFKPKGCFTCDFGLPGDLPLDLVPALIERDRMYMAEQPGMRTKHLPLRIDFNTGNLLSGGRYLFDTFGEAEDYLHWVTNDFILDGVSFLQRPIFLAPECYAWKVIGTCEFSPVGTQIIMRTERFSVPSGNLEHLLKQKWDDVQAEAQARGMASVWLTYNDEENLAQLVYFTDRIVPQDPNQPDFASLGTLESAPPLGHLFDSYGWTKTFDRTQWVLTIWFPFVTGDHGQPSLWPHSPPFPQPFSGDGVCEVSRGENSTNSPTDCGPKCGNGVCNPGETTQNCPGDCRLP